VIISKNNVYSRAQERIILNNFLDDVSICRNIKFKGDKTSLDIKRFTYIYSIDDLRSYLNKSLTNYYQLEENSIEDIHYTYDENNKIIDPELEIVYSEHNHTLNKEDSKMPIKKDYIYNINSTYLGPFQDSNSLEDIRHFLADVNYMLVTFEFSTNIPFQNSEKQCLQWVYKSIDLLNFSLSNKNIYFPKELTLK